MKDLTILLMGLGLVWVMLSHAGAGDASAADRAARLAAEARITALQATITALKPTPHPCGPPVAGRC